MYLKLRKPHCINTVFSFFPFRKYYMDHKLYVAAVSVIWGTHRCSTAATIVSLKTEISADLDTPQVSCNLTIVKTSNRIKTTVNGEFTVSQHDADCACAPVGELIKRRIRIFDSDHAGQQREGNKVFSEHTRKWCGFGAAAYWLLVSWFTVESKCIMRAL